MIRCRRFVVTKPAICGGLKGGRSRTRTWDLFLIRDVWVSIVVRRCPIGAAKGAAKQCNLRPRPAKACDCGGHGGRTKCWGNVGGGPCGGLTSASAPTKRKEQVSRGEG